MEDVVHVAHRIRGRGDVVVIERPVCVVIRLVTNAEFVLVSALLHILKDRLELVRRVRVRMKLDEIAISQARDDGWSRGRTSTGFHGGWVNEAATKTGFPDSGLAKVKGRGGAMAAMDSEKNVERRVEKGYVTL